MDPNREKMLMEVMAADFTSFELQLYLDTHPYDQNALALYNSNVKMARMIKDNYERLYGPIASHSSYSKYPWQWIESPWPWERQ